MKVIILWSGVFEKWMEPFFDGCKVAPCRVTGKKAEKCNCKYHKNIRAEKKKKKK